MKRMTKKIGKHYTFHDCDIICDKCFGGCKVSQQVMDKYGELEDLLEKELGTVDLELTKSVFDEWHNYLQFAGERNAFERMLGDVAGKKVDWERLRELAKADKDGRCVVLPCKKGDTVWRIVHDATPHITKDRCTNIKVENKEVWVNLIGDRVMGGWNFGKVLFLNEKEAEVALKAREQE